MNPTEARKEWLALCARMDEMCGGPEWRDRVVGGFRLGDGWAEFGLFEDPEKPRRSESYGIYQINSIPPRSPRIFSAIENARMAAHLLKHPKAWEGLPVRDDVGRTIGEVVDAEFDDG